MDPPNNYHLPILELIALTCSSFQVGGWCRRVITNHITDLRPSLLQIFQQLQDNAIKHQDLSHHLLWLYAKPCSQVYTRHVLSVLICRALSLSLSSVDSCFRQHMPRIPKPLPQRAAEPTELGWKELWREGTWFSCKHVCDFSCFSFLWFWYFLNKHRGKRRN